ncbi:helix-turn-helix domain-containing protein [Campylobacter fetus subsp. venerealis]|uniref:helix-turn-helix domain-containing protein n=1 Tax=Campylobacter fetus TaxID=196 RepID=UPI0018E6DDCA|nr:helix-turn-helix domain-containing protein [Campylobacter fetus]QQF52102.1 helix-turn-helix domain-containing protein [Campylobacter fetus subsp. venerealis]
MKRIQNDDLMSIEQLEQEFGISKNAQAKARMKINQGKPNSIPFYKYGKTILYSRKAINEWLQNFAVNF